MRVACLVVLLLAQPAAAQAPAEPDWAEPQKPPEKLPDKVLEKAGDIPTSEPVAPPGACDPQEAAELRALLERDSRYARKWNIAWASIFGASAVGSLAVGLANPFPDLQTGLYVSAGKAGIGALGRLILPLRIPVPAPNSDACADVKALRAAVQLAAKRERGNFYLNHVAGILVNGGGALIIWKYSTGGQALLSVAIGYPVGLLSNYTAPRRSWHYFREHNWTVAVVPAQNAWLVTLGGEL